MTYKIAICDDMEQDAQYIAAAVKKWAEQANVYADIHTFRSAEGFLFDYAAHKDYDILLLDIEMPSINGVELAKRVRRENEAVVQKFLDDHPLFSAETVHFPESSGIPDAAMTTLLPCDFGTDGFFICKLRRKP